MKNKIVTLSFLLTTILLLSNCGAPKNLGLSKVENLPKSYDGKLDSTSSANVPWKLIFTDTVLQGLIEEGVKNNFDLLIALEKINQANNGFTFSKRSFLPTTDVYSSAGQRKFGNYTMDWAGNKTTEMTPGRIIPMHLQDYSVGLRTSWEIDIWGKLKNRKRASLYRLTSTLEGKNLILTNLIAEISSAYYQLVALDYEQAVIKETIKNQTAALDLVKVQREVGFVNELALKQFEAQLLHAKTLEFEVAHKIVVWENTINNLLGRFPQPIARTKNSWEKFNSTQLKEGIPSELLIHRPDVRMAENELYAARADVNAAKAAFYPSLRIDGSVGYQSFNTQYLFSSPASIAYSIFGNLTAPLLNRKEIKLEFKNANSMQVEALYNYHKSVINGVIEVSTEVNRMKNLNEQLIMKKLQTDKLKYAVEISKDLFRAGKSNYLEVLSVQSNVLQAEMELITIRMEQSLAIIDLYKTLGGGYKL